MNVTRAFLHFWRGVLCAILALVLSEPWAQAESFPEPTRYTAQVSPRGTLGDVRGFEVALKRFARPGARPILLIAGLGGNDRLWDSPVREFNFARRLFEAGYDVWIGNFRDSGTRGFRSTAPQGPAHWTVDDYAVDEVPALIGLVERETRLRPTVIAHSLAAWALEGYLGGLRRLSRHIYVSDPVLGALRQKNLRAVVSIAGVYGLWWPKRLDRALVDPILDEAEYFQSNYEIESLALVPGFGRWIYGQDRLPLGWLHPIFFSDVSVVPLIGGTLSQVYGALRLALARTPVFNMFYYSKNADPQMVAAHVDDGLEDQGPRLIEQLGNAYRIGETTTFYHEVPPPNLYRYSSVRSTMLTPTLFIAGTRDRLANSEMIAEDGFERTRAPHRRLIRVEAGHLDIVNGRRAAVEVVAPLLEWLRER